MATAVDIKGRMAAFLRQPVERLEDIAVLTDLVTESFILVEMVIELQEQLGVRITQDDLKEVKTVGDLTAVFAAKTQPL